ncbi:MAG: 4Fe-4S binding protein [Desulfobacter sp.]|nr:4Fe-4S binding protein [Desulfobacter sp.]
MKRLGDILMNRTNFQEILMGNQAIVRAMIETGTRVVTSYPGSPTPEIATAIESIPIEDRPFYFEFSVNEKVATEVAFGAAVNGNLSSVFYKSVGLNVALDSFVQLSLMNITGGLVVILGDDPGANSSQNEQDNRNIYKISRVTVLEPADPQEAYLYYIHAAALAAKEQTVVVLRLTTHVCHARQKIKFGQTRPPLPYKTEFKRENGPYIALTTMALDMKRGAIQKLSRSKAFVRQAGLNTIDKGSARVKKGIITSGLTYLSLLDVLEFAAVTPGILKLGAVNPLDESIILSFLRSHDQVLILEELDEILELQIKSMAYDNGLTTQIVGKTSPEDFVGEYVPDKVWDKIRSEWPGFLPEREANPVLLTDVPPRPAQMCPGCGHRSAFFAIKKVLEKQDVTVADIGCHTLGYMPPYEVGEILMCVGASCGMASGLALNNAEKRVVAFLGDSTFFHAGLPGLINAIFNDHDITLILMENGTTAMTGHQDHAGGKVAVESLLKGLGIESIFSCDTYNQDRLGDMVKQAMAVKGLSVVIARHPCMLKFNRIQRKKPGFVQHCIEIDQTLCSHTHECVEGFGCPAFVRKPEGKIDINPDLCIGDGSCRTSCPEQAIGFHRRNK